MLSEDEKVKICDIVYKARFSVGFGPISYEEIDSHGGKDQASNMRLAAVQYMRVKLGITEIEIKEEDIVKTFLPDDNNIPRIYVEFCSHEQADFCLSVARELRNLDLSRTFLRNSELGIE